MTLSRDLLNDRHRRSVFSKERVVILIKKLKKVKCNLIFFIVAFVRKRRLIFKDSLLSMTKVLRQKYTALSRVDKF